MNASTTVIAGCGDDQNAGVGGLPQRAVEVSLGFGGNGLLAGADIDDGYAALECKADGAGKIELRGRAQQSIFLWKKYRKNQPLTLWHQAADRLLRAEQQAAYGGRMRIEATGIGRHHRVHQLERSRAQQRVIEIREAVDHADSKGGRSCTCLSEGL